MNNDVKLDGFRCVKDFYGYKTGYLYPFAEFEDGRVMSSPCTEYKYFHKEEFDQHFVREGFSEYFIKCMNDSWRTMDVAWNSLVKSMPYYYRNPDHDLFDGNFLDFMAFFSRFEFSSIVL
jgi:hypothetical protein